MREIFAHDAQTFERTAAKLFARKCVGMRMFQRCKNALAADRIDILKLDLGEVSAVLIVCCYLPYTFRIAAICGLRNDKHCSNDKCGLNGIYLLEHTRPAWN